MARNPLKLPDTQYEPITWAMIDGWADDDHNAAFATFLKSCKAILQGPPSRDGQPMVGALFKVCQKAVEAKPQKPGEARAFFEQNFRPVRISPLGTPDGFVTGYYEPIVEGTTAPTGGYDFPLYRKPPNLLPGGRMAVAGAPAPSTGKKKKREPKRKVVPFYDRAAIDDGVLAGRDLEICWLKDPIDSFFIHIQGSVRVLLDDGKLMRLNYAAANGHPYYAVGPLADRPQHRAQRRNVDGPHPRMDGAQSRTRAGAAAEEQVLRVLPRDPSAQQRGADRRAGHLADAGPLDRGRSQAAHLRHAVLHLGLSCRSRG